MTEEKPYKLFVFDLYEPYGGLCDLYDGYPTYEEAVEALMNMEVKPSMFESAHIGKDYEIIQAFSCMEKPGNWRKID